jgi:hypothetical protein
MALLSPARTTGLWSLQPRSYNHCLIEKCGCGGGLDRIVPTGRHSSLRFGPRSSRPSRGEGGCWGGGMRAYRFNSPLAARKQDFEDSCLFTFDFFDLRKPSAGPSNYVFLISDFNKITHLPDHHQHFRRHPKACVVYKI